MYTIDNGNENPSPIPFRTLATDISNIDCAFIIKNKLKKEIKHPF